jgi:hypothetical protein
MSPNTYDATIFNATLSWNSRNVDGDVAVADQADLSPKLLARHLYPYYLHNVWPSATQIFGFVSRILEPLKSYGVWWLREFPH